MANEKQRRAFISYSRINKEFATKLVKGLRAGGYSVWFDLLDIPTGSRWDDEVEKALRECSIFMIILTPASIASENVKDEIGYAIDHGKRILPVLLEECDVPLRLRRFQYVDFTTKSFEEGFESAKELLGDLIEQASIPLPAKTPVIEAPVDQKSVADGFAKQQAEDERIAKAESERNATQKHETTDFSVEREKVLKASTLMAQGKELLQNGKLSEAVQVFQQILTLMPNHERTLILLAEAKAGILEERESSDRNTKQEVDQLAAQKAEADRLVKQKAEDERIAKAKAETERKVKEEADRLAAQKAKADQKNVISTVNEQTASGTKSRKTINDWLKIWWSRGFIVALVMAVLGFVLIQGSGASILIIVISIVIGVFGFMFYPHKTSYILTAVFGVIGTIILLPALGGLFSESLWLGLGLGFIPTAIISRILHAIKKI